MNDWERRRAHEINEQEESMSAVRKTNEYLCFAQCLINRLYYWDGIPEEGDE